MGQTPWAAVLNLGNSIIGVSILAMPWCFSECGILLGMLLLLVVGLINKFSCTLLLRASKASRKTSYGSLSYHALGSVGKLTVEVSIILLLISTCIAFFVIIGDLAPSLISKLTGLENSWNLRTYMLLGVAIFIILPFSQKKNIESLSGLSTISICFYCFFATSVFIDSLPKLMSLSWVNDVHLWRPAGLLKAMSIFALSMCCQPCVFPVYNSLLERTPKQMEDVVSKSVNLVSFVYMCIGFFGYITYYADGVKGDVLLNQPPSILADALKLCFALSVALSFPLAVFPCRSSIFSLLFPSQAESGPIGGITYIPPTMFRIITLVILTFALTVAILIPNVEVVLSLTGSTMGSLACFIMPAIIYQQTIGVPTRFMPKVLLVAGLAFMLFSTYDNIRPAPVESHIPAPVPAFDKLDVKPPADAGPVGAADTGVEKPNADADEAQEIMGLQGDDVIKDGEKVVDAAQDTGDKVQEKDEAGPREPREREREREREVNEDHRHEPPVPHAPVDSEKDDKGVEEILKNAEKKAADEIERAHNEEEGENQAEEVEVEEEEEGEEQEKEEQNDAEGEGGGDDDQPVVVRESQEKEVDEGKLKAQEKMQEEQGKKLEELQARQAIQERIINKQAEEINKLKKEHEDEKAVVEAGAHAVQGQGNQQLAGLQQPVAGQPLAGQPLAGQPVVGQPVVGQPVVGQPVVGQPVVGQPVVGQPVADQLMANQPNVVQQVVGQPVEGQPVMAGQPVAGQVAGQPVAVQPLVGQPVGVQQPIVGQPVAGQVGDPALAAGQLGAGAVPQGQQPLPQAGAGQIGQVPMVQVAGQGQQLLQQPQQQQLQPLQGQQPVGGIVGGEQQIAQQQQPIIPDTLLQQQQALLQQQQQQQLLQQQQQQAVNLQPKDVMPLQQNQQVLPDVAAAGGGVVAMGNPVVGIADNQNVGLADNQNIGIANNQIVGIANNNQLVDVNQAMAGGMQQQQQPQQPKKLEINNTVKPVYSDRLRDMKFVTPVDHE